MLGVFLGQAGGCAGQGLTADGDAQLHAAPLGQLHMEGAAARDDRLWVQIDTNPGDSRE